MDGLNQVNFFVDDGIQWNLVGLWNLVEFSGI